MTTLLKDSVHKEKGNKVSDYIDLCPKMVHTRAIQDILQTRFSCTWSVLKWNRLGISFYENKLGMSFFFWKRLGMSCCPRIKNSNLGVWHGSCEELHHRLLQERYQTALAPNNSRSCFIEWRLLQNGSGSFAESHYGEPAKHPFDLKLGVSQGAISLTDWRMATCTTSICK